MTRRRKRIAAYRKRLAERSARVEEDVAYRFARAEAAHELRWAAVRERIDMAAAAELSPGRGLIVQPTTFTPVKDPVPGGPPMFNAPVRIRSDRAQAVREQSLTDQRLK